jgi:4,5:9,10-diseco-3-hydroxy-5,9,17-trioxoandrosta-1(10),2-diene-4-oate hydrolase
MNDHQRTHGLALTTIAVGSRSIRLAEAGDGPPLLMLHGGGPGASGVSNYSRNIAALARQFRVLVPDLPGYGKSSKDLSRTDPFGDLAGSMLGLLGELGIRRAPVVGNSLGGACALRMALERPDRISRLVLMGPGGIGTSRGLPMPGLRRLLGYYEGDGPTIEKLRTFLRDDLVYDGRAISDDLVRARFESSIDPEVLANPPLRRPRGLSVLMRMDLTRDPRLADLKTPTLVLWGTEDRVNRPSGGRSLQRRMPNCDLYLFSRTGHWVQWERAEEFNAVTTAFFSQPDSGGSSQ